MIRAIILLVAYILLLSLTATMSVVTLSSGDYGWLALLLPVNCVLVIATIEQSVDIVDACKTTD